MVYLRMMRIFLALIFFNQLMTPFPALSADPISREEINRRGVMGEFGHPLGKIIRVDGTIVANRETSKEFAGKSFLLEVKSVNSVLLPTPITTTYNPSAFTRLKTPKIGATFGYMAYETGAYSGSPVGEFDYLPAYASPQFHFRTHLLLLVSLSPS